MEYMIQAISQTQNDEDSYTLTLLKSKEENIHIILQRRI